MEHDYPGLHCDNHLDNPKYEKKVRRLASMHLVAAQSITLAPVTSETRALAACRELVSATGEVKRLTRIIGDGVRACLAEFAKADPGNFTAQHAPHLAAAYAHIVIEEATQYDSGEVGYLPLSDQLEILAECPFCLSAHNAIQERKVARKRLGAARRAVTMIGRAA